MDYKACFVLNCGNNSTNNPDKLYFLLPRNLETRKKWYIAFKQSPLRTKQHINEYCCSDHFDLQRDIVPFTTSKLKTGVIPSLPHNDIQPRRKTMKAGESSFKRIKLCDKTDERRASDQCISEAVCITEMNNKQFLQEHKESETECQNVRDPTKTLHATKISQSHNPSQKNDTKSNNIQPKSAPENKIRLKRNKMMYTSIPDKVQPKFQGIAESQYRKYLRTDMIDTIYQPRPERGTLPSTTITYGIVPKQQFSVIKSSTSAPSPTPIASTVKQPNSKDGIENLSSKMKNRKIAVKTTEQTPPNKLSVLICDKNEPATTTLTSSAASNLENKILKNISSCSVKEISTPKASLGTITPIIEPKLKVLDFGTEIVSITGAPKKTTEEQVFKVIQLMISENPSLIENSPSNSITITKTHFNEFKILDKRYFYKTEEFFKNYFYMDVTRNSTNSDEVIGRNYVIYWGDQPRLSLVGVVETKGTLSNETKNFIFEEVKKNLLEDDRKQNMKEKTAVQPVRVLLNALSAHVANTSKPVVIKTKKTDMESKHLDSEMNKMKTVKESTNSITVNQPSTEKSLSSEPQNSTQTVSSQNKAIALDFSQREKHSYKKLRKLYTRLTPSMRKLINDLKYFQMPNGYVYSVSIPLQSSGNKNVPYNFLFMKNKPESKVKPVATNLAVSKLVNEIFEAITNSKLTVNDDTKKPRNVPIEVKIKGTNKVIKVTPTYVQKVIHEKQPLAVACSTIVKPEPPMSVVVPIPIPNTFSKMHSTKAIEPVSVPKIKIENVSCDGDASSCKIVVMQPKSANIQSTQKLISPVPLLTMQSTPILPSTNIVDSSNNNATKEMKMFRKYKCQICSEAFERAYQLKRHDFIQHIAKAKLDLLNAKSNVITSNTSVKNVFDSRCATPIIKEEKLDEKIASENSLLIPLFENIVNESRKKEEYSNDMQLVKCKEEPEEFYYSEEKTDKEVLPRVKSTLLKKKRSRKLSRLQKLNHIATLRLKHLQKNTEKKVQRR